MQRLEVSGAVRPIYGSLGVKRLIQPASFSFLNILITSRQQLYFLPFRPQ